LDKGRGRNIIPGQAHGFRSGSFDLKAQKLPAEDHFYVWDELAVIFMNRPSLFKFVPAKENPLTMHLLSYDAKGAHNTYLKLLGFAADSHILSRHLVLLKEIPSDPILFREDIEPFVKKIIEKHGLEEWKAALLTNEFHRHLGIYSIIGAKMGGKGKRDPACANGRNPCRFKGGEQTAFKLHE